MIGFILFLCIGCMAIGFCLGMDCEKQKTKKKAFALMELLDHYKPEERSEFAKTYNDGMDAIKNLIEGYFCGE